MSRGSAWLYNYHALENSAVLWINMKGTPNLSLGFKDSSRGTGQGNSGWSRVRSQAIRFRSSPLHHVMLSRAVRRRPPCSRQAGPQR
jgi:hypothetical protein